MGQSDLIGASGFSSISGFGAGLACRGQADSRRFAGHFPDLSLRRAGWAAEDCAQLCRWNYGALVNASRSLIAAWRTVASSDAADAGADYAAATRAAALRMRDELRAAAL